MISSGGGGRRQKKIVLCTYWSLEHGGFLANMTPPVRCCENTKFLPEEFPVWTENYKKKMHLWYIFILLMKK